jgi:cell division protein FtsW
MASVSSLRPAPAGDGAGGASVKPGSTGSRKGSGAGGGFGNGVMRNAAGLFQGRVLVLASTIGALCAIGLVMVLSASAAEAQSDYGNPWYQFQRQALWLIAGAVSLVIAAQIDYRRLRPWIRPFMAGVIVLLALVPFVGQTVNGATRWLAVGPLSVQPSELAKLALLLFVADLLAGRADRMAEYRLSLWPSLMVFGVLALLIMVQPNLGTTVLLFMILMSILWVAGLPARAVGLLVLAATVAGGAFAVLVPFRFRRLLAFVDPWNDPLNTGYQTLQSQAALANGGATGLGLGQGRAKFGFLPEGHTDFIFSNIGEEFGLLGSLVLLGLFATLAVIGALVAIDAPDRFGTLVAVGITAWISVQALVNLGAAVGVLPITGVPLPLVSSGGSSLTVTMIACGVLLNIARTSGQARAVGPERSGATSCA